MNKDLLKMFADNEAMVQAVRGVIEEKFNLEIRNMPVGGSAEQLGNLVSGRVDALRCIDEVFKEINQFKSITSKPEAVNPAR